MGAQSQWDCKILAIILLPNFSICMKCYGLWRCNGNVLHGEESILIGASNFPDVLQLRWIPCHVSTWTITENPGFLVMVFTNLLWFRPCCFTQQLLVSCLILFEYINLILFTSLIHIIEYLYMCYPFFLHLSDIHCWKFTSLKHVNNCEWCVLILSPTTTLLTPPIRSRANILFSSVDSDKLDNLLFIYIYVFLWWVLFFIYCNISALCGIISLS